MKLGFCSNAYTRHTLEDAIARVGAIGYAGIELLCDAPHFWPEAEPPDRIPRIREALDAAGLAVANVNANTAVGAYPLAIPENVFGPSLASPDPAVRARRADHVRAAVDLARATGAASVSLTLGAAGDDLPPEDALDLARGMLDGLLDHAEAKGVGLGLEAEPGLLLETTAEAAAFVAEVDHPRLGLNLDIGHAVVAGEDPAAMIRLHHARILHLHLEDIRGGKHFHRIPGQGDVDFAAIAAALREVGYGGFASVEVYPYRADPDAAAQASHDVLAPLFDRQ